MYEIFNNWWVRRRSSTFYITWFIDRLLTSKQYKWIEVNPYVLPPAHPSTCFLLSRSLIVNAGWCCFAPEDALVSCLADNCTTSTCGYVTCCCWGWVITRHNIDLDLLILGLPLKLIFSDLRCTKYLTYVCNLSNVHLSIHWISTMTNEYIEQHQRSLTLRQIFFTLGLNVIIQQSTLKLHKLWSFKIQKFFIVYI